MIKSNKQSSSSMFQPRDKVVWSCKELIENSHAYKLMKITELFGTNSNEYKLAKITLRVRQEVLDTKSAKIKAANRAMLYKRGF